ncbi:hypothetical protein YTPLAS72_23040 [Nitrospira sp.]|nr:hypothetical protein YTPLAS72_23040 [Nitrospira sp.]
MTLMCDSNTRDRTVLRHIGIGAMVLLAAAFPIDLLADSSLSTQPFKVDYSGKQGQILVVMIPNEVGTTRMRGTFLGRSVSFFPDTRLEARNGFVGLLGIDLQDEPGIHELTVDVETEERDETVTYRVEVLKEDFHVERLTLPKSKVDLDKKSLARWKREQARVKKLLANESVAKLWERGFVEPVAGKRTGIFGSVRIMNGQPRNPHNGEDIGAPLGTEVVSTNDGIVRLTVDHIFSGKGIFVDHGLGLFSMYFHLSEVLVKEGDHVKAGAIIGRVGATGRATGPHLHWGVKLNGARVNPYALLDLPFKGSVQSATPIPVTDSGSGVGSPEP